MGSRRAGRSHVPGGSVPAGTTDRHARWAVIRNPGDLNQAPAAQPRADQEHQRWAVPRVSAERAAPRCSPPSVRRARCCWPGGSTGPADPGYRSSCGRPRASSGSSSLSGTPLDPRPVERPLRGDEHSHPGVDETGPRLPLTRRVDCDGHAHRGGLTLELPGRK